MTTAQVLLSLKELAALLPKEAPLRARAFEKFLALFPTHFRLDPLPLFDEKNILKPNPQAFLDEIEGNVEEEQDLWALLNLAFCEKEQKFFVGSNTDEKMSYELIDPSEKKGALFSPRIHLHLAKQAHLHFTLSEKNEQNFALMNGVIEVHLQEGSSCTFTHLGGFSESAKRLLLRVHLAKESQFHLEIVGGGSSLYRRKYEMMLDGAFSEVTLFGLFLLSKNECENITSHIAHRAFSTRSNQHFRAAAADESCFNCKGCVHIEKAAVNAEAHQICRSLLLSESAKATIEPFLEINNDEVKATHGATIGKISEEELFYLRARGLNQKRARELLTLAFMQEVVECFSTEQMREQAEKRVKRIYGNN